MTLEPAAPPCLWGGQRGPEGRFGDSGTSGAAMSVERAGEGHRGGSVTLEPAAPDACGVGRGSQRVGSVALTIADGLVFQRAQGFFFRI